MKDLSCAEDETTTTSSITSSSANSQIVTDLTSTVQDDINEITTEDIIVTTEHTDNNKKTTSFITSTASPEIKMEETQLPSQKNLRSNKLNHIYIEKNVNLGSLDYNNQQSNFIPKIASDENLLIDEQQEKLEDEKHKQHKMLHEEFAKFGNFENIFTQPTDHFVPPLVMAKAKISDDMTVLSLAEKHAQQLAEQHFPKQIVQYGQTDKEYQNNDSVNIKTSTKEPIIEYSDKPLVSTLQTNLLKSNMKKDKVPKKYVEKYNDLTSKLSKYTSVKSGEFQKSTEISLIQTEFATKDTQTTAMNIVDHELDVNQFDDSPIIDLKVIIKDNPVEADSNNGYTKYTGDMLNIENVQNISRINETLKINSDVNITQNKLPPQSKLKTNDMIVHEIVTITIPAENKSTLTPITFEMTTNMPIFTDKINNNNTTLLKSADISKKSEHIKIDIRPKKDPLINNEDTTTSLKEIVSTSNTLMITANVLGVKIDTDNLKSNVNTGRVIKTSTASQWTEVDKNYTTIIPEIHSTTKAKFEEIEIEEHDKDNDNNNTTDTSETIDDFQSPLLSGANDPLPRPNRSRRPQQQPNRNKFNPFRILG